jgi:hypothetical protein
MLKRWGKMAERYQGRIDQQKSIIDRLMAAMTVYSDLAYEVEHDARSIKEARQLSVEAQAKVKAILAVPGQGQVNEEETDEQDTDTGE